MLPCKNSGEKCPSIACSCCVYLALLRLLNTRQAAVDTAVHYCGAGQQCMGPMFLLNTKCAAITLIF